MSDDLLKQDEPKDEDVEAHKHKFTGTDDPTSDDDDVEAHKHKFAGNDEPGSDDSDDVEAHRHKAM